MTQPPKLISQSRREPSARAGTTPLPVAMMLLRFLAVYLLLTLPWPGWDSLYGQYFRTIARTAYPSNSRRELIFNTPGEKSARPLDTRVEIVNRTLTRPDGTAPTRDMEFDARGFSWQPTALLIALIIATPLPWSRRRRALLWGLPVLQASILILLGFCIWNESADVALVTFNPFWKTVTGTLQDLILEQSGVALPAMVWLLVTFRREDRSLWQR
jgi:hypothetical protein